MNHEESGVPPLINPLCCPDVLHCCLHSSGLRDTFLSVSPRGFIGKKATEDDSPPPLLHSIAWEGAEPDSRWTDDAYHAHLNAWLKPNYFNKPQI